MKHSKRLILSALYMPLTLISIVQEGGRKPPPYPSVFVKPSTSIAGFDEDVPIPKIAQDGTLDYEGELVSLSSLHLMSMYF